MSIQNNVNEVIEYSQKKKGMFSSDEIQVWKCSLPSCGNIMNAEVEICPNCHYDKFDFHSHFYNRNKAILNLKEKIEILKEQFT